jgi:DNA-binding CsgD family transcriptional regulator
MPRLGPRERGEFLAIKAACYSGLGSAELLAAVGARLGGSVRADATCMVQLDPVTALPIYFVSQGWSEEDPRILAESALLASATADPGRLIQQRRRTVVVETLVATDVPFRQDPYFVHHLLPAGYRYELQTACAIGQRGQALLTVTRREATGAFEAAHMRLLDAIAPHVAAGLRAATIRETLTASPAAAAGFILLNGENAVELANATGERWLTTSDPPGRPGRLWALHVLAGMLRRSLTVDGAADVPQIELADPVSGVLHRLRGERVQHTNGTPGTLITLEPVHAVDRPETLRRLGLTPREADVAVGILRGESVASLAHQLGVSPHTVTQHVRNTFLKLGVSSRRELMLRLVGLR